MTTNLESAAKAYHKAESALDRARSRLNQEIAEAANYGIRQTEIVRITGLTREHIRRIVKRENESPF